MAAKSTAGRFELRPLPFEHILLTACADWAVARSALDLMLRCTLGAKTRYEIGWINKIGKGLSKEVYRAEGTIFYGKEKRTELYAISQLSHAPDGDAGTSMIREQLLLDAIGNNTVYIALPMPLGMVCHSGRLIAIASFVAGINLAAGTRIRSRRLARVEYFVDIRKKNTRHRLGICLPRRPGL